MGKISYKIDGKTIELEVDDKFAKEYAKIDAESKRNDWKFAWRQRKLDCSLNSIMDNGYDIPDDSCELCEEENDDANTHQKTNISVEEIMGVLEPQQQWLVEQLYILGRTQEDVASELGISDAAIRNRVKKIRKKLKKFMK